MIAATHRDLAAMIREDKFREDLFYRLNVFPIEIPPLRERREDIPLLVHYFVSKLSRQMGKKIESIPKQAMEALAGASWPGNVRELENFIERAVILTQGSELYVPLAEMRRDTGAWRRLGADISPRVHISRRRAAGHHQCAKSGFRQDCRHGRRGRTPWSEAHHPAEQDAPAQPVADRLVAGSK